MKPPRRYSIGQPDFDPEIGARLRISVDGVLQSKVVEYKTEVGDDGRIVIDREKAEVVREVISGTVTVEWRGESECSAQH